MKYLTIILITFFLNTTNLISQVRPLTIVEIEQNRQKITRNGSISLAIWSGLNITAGTIGYFTQPKSEWTYFQEMNVFWNIVNLGLAIPGMVIKDRPNTSVISSLKKHNQFQTVYLFNAALDISYITAGVFLRILGDEKSDIRMKGYGSSLILQGGYLMIYDLIQYFLLQRNASHLSRADLPVRLISQSSGLPGIGIVISLNQ